MSDPAAIVTKRSPRSFAETVDRCLALISERGMKLFVVVDHSGEARTAGLSLRDTKVVMFGNPRGGTPVMDAAPLAALDLPLKVLVWADGETTNVSYTPPGVLAARYGFDAALAAPLSVIDALTDALVAP
jgi:uncharacterized protein (DUF302 family)